MSKYLKLSSALVAGLTLLVVSACGTSGNQTDSTASTASNSTTAGTQESQSAAPKEKIKLRVMTITTDEARNTIMEKYIKPNVEAAFPDVEVQFEAGGGSSDYSNKLKTYNASGDMPDVWWGGSDLVPPMVEAGNILDMKPYLQKDNFIGNYSVPEALDYKGKIYALNSGSDSYFAPVVFYHKDMFEQAGVQVPKTFDELMKVVQTLNSKGIVPISTPGKGGWAPNVFLIQSMIQIGDPQAMLDLINNKTDFNNPSVIAGLSRIKQMVNADAFPKGVSNLDYGPAKELFTSKKTAMYMMETWELPDLAKDPSVDFFPIPTVSGVSESTSFVGSPLNGYSVYAKSKHIDQAVKLAEFLATADAQYFESTGAPVSLKTGKATEEPAPLMKKFLDWYNGGVQKLPPFGNALDTKASAEFATMGANLLTSDYTADQFVKDFNPIWKANTMFK